MKKEEKLNSKESFAVVVGFSIFLVILAIICGFVLVLSTIALVAH